MGVSGASVNQTVVTTTSGSSSNLNVSSFSIPLPTFTSKAPINSSSEIVLQVTPETRITTELTGAQTPLPRRTLPVSSAGAGSAWTTPVHTVMAKEQKVVEEKVPVLGPSVPVVMIFVIVVAGIAWWNYKFNSEEHNRSVVLDH